MWAVLVGCLQISATPSLASIITLHLPSYKIDRWGLRTQREKGKKVIKDLNGNLSGSVRKSEHSGDRS